MPMLLTAFREAPLYGGIHSVHEITRIFNDAIEIVDDDWCNDSNASSLPGD
eukprot:m.195457 g.195457  ORF g.195457 m.195457 type:complete len:51 (+) comp39517_c0_seq72:1713-1865(+)